MPYKSGIKTERSIGAIIVNSAGKYLVLRRAEPHRSGLWEFPRGHQRDGETDMQTLKREIKEETGISRFRIIKGFRKQTSHRHKDGGLHRIIHYLAVVENPKVKLSEEHVTYEWLDLRDAIVNIGYHKDLVQMHFEKILKKADALVRKSKISGPK